MIGRAAQGKPWIFSELNVKLNGAHYLPPTLNEIKIVICQHLENIYRFYGDLSGVRIARKHIGWYFEHLGSLPSTQKSAIYHAKTPKQQLALVNASFNFIIPRAA